jgi:multidrug efflux pump subunit AcrB
LALLILILSPEVILHTPTDIFPTIDIPVISVAWTYTGLNPEDLETRLTTPFEKVLTTLVDNIQHVESTTYNGTSVVKIYLQPGASLDRANSQVVAASGFILRFLPPATLFSFRWSPVRERTPHRLRLSNLCRRSLRLHITGRLPPLRPIV